MISDNSKKVCRAVDKSNSTKPNYSFPTGEPKTTERHHKPGGTEPHAAKRPRAHRDGDLDNPTCRAAKAPKLAQLPYDDDEDDEISSDGIESTMDGDEERITKKITATPIAGGNVLVKIPGQNGGPPSLTELSKANFEAFKASQGVIDHHTI